MVRLVLLGPDLVEPALLVLFDILELLPDLLLHVFLLDEVCTHQVVEVDPQGLVEVVELLHNVVRVRLVLLEKDRTEFKVRDDLFVYQFGDFLFQELVTVIGLG